MQAADIGVSFHSTPEDVAWTSVNSSRLTLSDISFPVGRVQFMWMRPLSFAEFLNGTGQALLSEKLPTFGNEIDVSAGIHARFVDQLRLYFIVGGMPEAVNCFAQTASLQEVGEVHRALVLGFQQSFVKYNQRANVAIIESLLEQVPRRVACQIKYAHLDRDHHTQTIKTALAILERALVISRVRASNAQGLPLGAGVRPKVFKAIFLDIGLMQHLSGTDVTSILHRDDLLKVYRGALAEQFVGQELLANGPGCERDKLYYWARAQRSSNAEVDYVLARQGRVHALEVKSGPRGKLRSLALFQHEHAKAGTGLVLSPGVRKSSLQGDILFLPLYLRFQ